MNSPSEPTFQLPAGMSTIAPEYDWLYYFIYWAGLILFVAIVGLMLAFVIRYHRSRGHQPKPTESHTAAELIWTFTPLIILVTLFHWGFQGYVRGSVAPDNALDIRVRGKQWLWEFEYPNGYREIGTLKVPVHQPIRLVMSSDDVLHSFFVPEFRWKKDVVPGMYSTMWFEATRTGKAQVFCAEYCGVSHAGMLATVEIVSEAEYEKFLKEGSGPPAGVTPDKWGAMLYTKNNCNTCHSLDGSALVGPSWKGVWGRTETMTDGSSITVDENYVRQSILEPNAKTVRGFNPVMPVYTLQDQQIDALIAFMKTLK